MFNPWVGKIPWRRERIPTPVLWPGEFHGLYSSWGCNESDTTEWLSLKYLLTTFISPYLKKKNNLLPISILTPLPNSYIKCTLTFGHNSTSFFIQGLNKNRKCKETWLEHMVEWKEICFLYLLRIISSCLPRKRLIVTYCYGQKQSESGLRSLDLIHVCSSNSILLWVSQAATTLFCCPDF